MVRCLRNRAACEKVVRSFESCQKGCILKYTTEENVIIEIDKHKKSHG